MGIFKDDLEWSIWFKKEFGISPQDLTRQVSDSNREVQSDFDSMVYEKTGHLNGCHPDAYHDVHIDWEKIKECEDDGYYWPTMPWLPAPCERVGKSKLELNMLAWSRREHYKLMNSKG